MVCQEPAVERTGGWRDSSGSEVSAGYGAAPLTKQANVSSMMAMSSE